jgi:hypothetical protein
MSKTAMDNLIQNVINYYGFKHDKQYVCPVHKVIMLKYGHLDSKEVYRAVKQRLS